VLYAEDRNLLPDEVGPYADHSLTRLRLEVAAKKAKGDRLSDRMKHYWSRLDDIFEAIGQGDNDLGIPPYNGGLFDPAAAPILARVQLPDAVVADVIFRMSHLDLGDGRPPKYINYRDLSVQQLGSVYERILEHGLSVQDGQIVVAENPAARKGSGSYYTPEELVALIIERAVGPLVSKLIECFTAKAAQLAGEKRPKEAQLADLVPLDPASRILELKICDPAMGSGHFLVSLVDWLSDRVLDAMAEAAAAVSFATYISPLEARIAAIRTKILAEAKAHGWPIAEGQLDDRHIVRRMVLKRVVYGVDKNPMAVELAKVALWLHSFTVGAPLSFLDHHLRCGDSVLGAWTQPTVNALQQRGALFNTGVIAGVERVARLMAEIEQTTDNDISEVAASKAKFGEIDEETRPVAAFFSLLTAEKLMGVFGAAPRKAPLAAQKMEGRPEGQLKRWRSDVAAFEAASAFQLALEGTFGDPVRIATGEAAIAPPDLVLQIAEGQNEAEPQLFPHIAVDDRRRVLADRLVNEALSRATEHRFFHWEIGFPNVWSNLLSAMPCGGFDAVIGNPPYVRQELLGDELKRALKAGYRAYDGIADLYVFFFEQGLRLLCPGGRLAYVVTNKWLRAGYAEALRDLFATAGRVEFIADFGHAKHFFPDADVFPSVVTVRKTVPGENAPTETQVCVIPRDAVPEKGLAAAVGDATYPLPLTNLTKDGWILQPPAEAALFAKIRRNGVRLAEYAGLKPLYGIKTGFNEAFLIDGPARDKLVADDPACADVIKPYQRGQDIDRWWSPPSGLYMIVLKSSGDYPWPWADAPDVPEAERRFHATYPSLHSHMKRYEEVIDQKTGKARGLRYREDQGRFWWELRPCTYYDVFDHSLVAYPDLSWSPSFQVLGPGTMLSNLTYMISAEDPTIPIVLNAPSMWWYLWASVEHGKDEVLRLFSSFMEDAPIAPAVFSDDLTADLLHLQQSVARIKSATASICDWLRHEFGVRKEVRALESIHERDGDAFVTAVRSALPKSRKFSSAEIARLKQEHVDTLTPARQAAAEVLAIERKLSDRVNAAYGLTPEEVALMWRTAPPRMPLDPKEELRRLGFTK
jgi:hypothetical protein